MTGLHGQGEPNLSGDALRVRQEGLEGAGPGPPFRVTVSRGSGPLMRRSVFLSVHACFFVLNLVGEGEKKKRPDSCNLISGSK